MSTGYTWPSRSNLDC